ncbi:hypothetical protein ACFSWE_04040 [Leucobacter albus]|uniref:Uncharacterized protein n=1 Tax=Leucobacter albus TaxID=272210 RepID=A0ABW3TMQ5_9MICO
MNHRYHFNQNTSEAECCELIACAFAEHFITSNQAEFAGHALKLRNEAYLREVNAFISELEAFEARGIAGGEK